MKQLTKDLYTCKPLNDHSWEVKLSDGNHPVFKAHFESNPLLPAFLQIDIMGEILNKNSVKIVKAKYKLPVLPNDIIMYKIIKKVDTTYVVKIFKESKIASELKLVYT